MNIMFASIFSLTVSQSLVATTWGNLRGFMCFLPSSTSLNFAIMGPISRVAAIIASGKVGYESDLKFINTITLSH